MIRPALFNGYSIHCLPLILAKYQVDTLTALKTKHSIIRENVIMYLLPQIKNDSLISKKVVKYYLHKQKDKKLICSNSYQIILKLELWKYHISMMQLIWEFVSNLRYSMQSTDLH